MSAEGRGGLGVVSALALEARPLAGRRVAPGRRALAAGARLEVCGAGGRRARSAARALLEEGAAALLSWGTAAALQPGLRPGCVLLPRAVATAAQQVLEVDARWHARVLGLLGTELAVETGLLVEARGVLADAAAKRDLHVRSGAVAADMESGAIAECAREAGVPVLVLRVVVDDAHTAIPAAVQGAISADGGLRPGRLLLGLLRDPQALGAAWRLRRGMKAAGRGLGETVRLLGPGLAWR